VPSSRRYPGCLGRAAAVCEALERGPADGDSGRSNRHRLTHLPLPPFLRTCWVTTSRISLSDNLKPGPVVDGAGMAALWFVIALYNPILTARPWQLERASAKLASRLTYRDQRLKGFAICAL